MRPVPVWKDGRAFRLGAGLDLLLAEEGVEEEALGGGDDQVIFVQNTGRNSSTWKEVGSGVRRHFFTHKVD